eukprot:403336059
MKSQVLDSCLKVYQPMYFDLQDHTTTIESFDLDQNENIAFGGNTISTIDGQLSIFLGFKEQGVDGDLLWIKKMVDTVQASNIYQINSVMVVDDSTIFAQVQDSSFVSTLLFLDVANGMINRQIQVLGSQGININLSFQISQFDINSALGYIIATYQQNMAILKLDLTGSTQGLESYEFTYANQDQINPQQLVFNNDKSNLVMLSSVCYQSQTYSLITIVNPTTLGILAGFTQLTDTSSCSTSYTEFRFEVNQSGNNRLTSFGNVNSQPFIGILIYDNGYSEVSQQTLQLNGFQNILDIKTSILDTMQILVESTNSVAILTIDLTTQVSQLQSFAFLKSDGSNQVKNGMLQSSNNFCLIGAVKGLTDIFSGYSRLLTQVSGLLYQSDPSQQAFVNDRTIQSIIYPLTDQSASFQYQQVALTDLTSNQISINSDEINADFIAQDLMSSGASPISFDFPIISNSIYVVGSTSISKLIVLPVSCSPSESIAFELYLKSNLSQIEATTAGPFKFISSTNIFTVETIDNLDVGNHTILVKAIIQNSAFYSSFIVEIKDQCSQVLITKPTTINSTMTYKIGYSYLMTYTFPEFIINNTNCLITYDLIRPTDGTDTSFLTFDAINRQILIDTNDSTNNAINFQVYIKAYNILAADNLAILHKIDIIMKHYCSYEQINGQIQGFKFYQITSSNSVPQYEPFIQFTRSNATVCSPLIYNVFEGGTQVFSTDINDQQIVYFYLHATNGYISAQIVLIWSLAGLDCSFLVMNTDNSVIPEFVQQISYPEYIYRFTPFELSIPECGPIQYTVKLTNTSNAPCLSHRQQVSDDMTDGISCKSDKKTDASNSQQKYEATLCGKSSSGSTNCTDFRNIVASNVAQINTKNELEIYTKDQNSFVNQPYTFFVNAWIQDYPAQNLEMAMTINFLVDCKYEEITPPSNYSITYDLFDSTQTYPVQGSYTLLFPNYCTQPTSFSYTTISGPTLVTSGFISISSSTGQLSVQSSNTAYEGTYILSITATTTSNISATHYVTLLIDNPCKMTSISVLSPLNYLEYDVSQGSYQIQMNWTQSNVKCLLPISYDIRTANVSDISVLGILATINQANGMLIISFTSNSYVGMHSLYILGKIDTYTQNTDNFTLNVTNTCLDSPSFTTIPIANQQYTVGELQSIIQVVPWSISPSYCGIISYTVYETNSKSTPFLSFDTSTLEIKVQTNLTSFTGVYNLTVKGQISSTRFETITFLLELVNPCLSMIISNSFTQFQYTQSVSQIATTIDLDKFTFDKDPNICGNLLINFYFFKQQQVIKYIFDRYYQSGELYY